MLKNIIFQKIAQEILWLFLFAIITYAVLFPIVNLGTYKFIWPHVIFISISLLYSRWVVFFNDIDYFKNKWFKIAIFLVNFQLFIYTISQLQDIIPLWETQKLEEFLYHIRKVLSIESVVAYLNYIRNTVLFSGISCCIATLFLSARIFSSFFIKNQLRKKAMLQDL